MNFQAPNTDLMELTGAIYDAAIDPRLWQATLDRLRLHFGFHLVGLGVTALPSGNAVLQVSVNMPEPYVSMMPRYGEAAMALWGGSARAGLLPLEEPLLTSQVSNPAEWPANAFYQDWARPQGLVDQVAIFLARDQTMIASLGLGIHESSPAVTDNVMNGLRLLAPHIRRAVTISRLLDLSVEAATTFEAAFEVTRAGIVIVEEDLTVILANGSAQDMLNAGDPIRRSDGRLGVRDELAPGHLQSAVRIAASDEGQLARRGIALPARLKDGTALAIHVMPLKRRSLRGNLGRRAAAAVFIAESGAPSILPADALALLYSLTPAETQVFELVAAGRSTREVAYTLGIAESTMRTHLLAVFAKTGCHSRVDLVRLSQELALPG